MVDGCKMQSQRQEFKYLVGESTARELRRHVQVHLTPDAFTTGEGYRVHSLYLDSPDLRLCQQTLCGEKNRFKLRVRFYDENDQNPVFLEIKRRITTAVLKQRACIRRDAFGKLMEGFEPDMGMLLRPDQKDVDALDAFCSLARRLHAQPAAYTSYVREAYEYLGDNSQRVTFDRHLRAGHFTGELSAASLNDWPAAPVDGVVFEMKFTDRFPSWMEDVAQQFQLQRISVPKYVECINVVDEQRSRQWDTPRRIVLDTPLRVSEQTEQESDFVSLDG